MRTQNYSRTALGSLVVSLLVVQGTFADQLCYTNSTSSGAYMPWTNNLTFPQFSLPFEQLTGVTYSVSGETTEYVNVHNPAPPNLYVTAIATNRINIKQPGGAPLTTLNFSNIGYAVVLYNQSKSILTGTSTNVSGSLPSGALAGYTGSGTVSFAVSAPAPSFLVSGATYGVNAEYCWGDVTMTLTYSFAPSAVTVWGNSYAPTPTNLTSVAAIGTGWYHSFVRLGDGSAELWGLNSFNDTVIPNGLADLVAMAGGQDHTIVLHGNGTVDAWGENLYGECDLQPGLHNIVGIAAGTYNSYVLTDGGDVYGWGDDTYGQVSGAFDLYNIVAISSLVNHGIALRSDGLVQGWGDDSFGQTDIPSGLGDVIAVAAGDRHSMALRADGTVVVWGDNTYGQTNVPAGLSNVVAIAAGFYHCLALRSDGAVTAWGNNDYGQTNVPAGLSNVVAVAAGGYQNLALSQAGFSAASFQASSARYSAGTFCLQAPTAYGRTYYLQHKDSLADPWWTPSLPVPGDGVVRTFTDGGASGSEGFYRVWQKP